MGKQGKYPTKICALIYELLLLVEKDKPKVDWPVSEFTREKMAAQAFCFLSQETRKLRKKINQLEAAQLPL